ncbi:hypothetical protein [Microbacterium terricola]|uniref:PBP domain-containing protein n=1 Tax=Microbacterium terricola TaxID=344163 RepID=A0ABM8E2N3_9MICO|nr:hypothetical protein [Microbacterium terricola]UYK40075.1 hypothetical protein OAU46_00025 [Microbacterium terricola]BDV32228.1 hypothetical protein Microterr_28880 [Microbacterium terricola]
MLRPSSRTSRTSWIPSLLAGGIVAGLTFGTMSLAGIAAAPSAAAADGSAVTVTAATQDDDLENAPFPDLAVTVSQTQDLVSQGIQVSWTGAAQSTVPSQQTGGQNFLQIFQCWGDDPDDVNAPDRTTCQYGATLTPGTTRDAFRDGDDTVAKEDEPYTVFGDGFANPTYTGIPFRSVTNEVVESVVDGKHDSTVDLNTNEFFTALTTNEVPWAGSGADGTGSVKFEVQTALQAPGLGCGTPVTADYGAVSGQSCWLVIVPRGTSDSGSANITQSGLFWDAWKHRIAVRLDFKALGLRCPIGAAERQLAGSELVSQAISSWQPALCNAKGGAIYSALTGVESDALIAANSGGAAPLALTTEPLAAGDGVTDTLQYAPIALTGLTVSFAVDREPKQSASEESKQRAGLPLTDLKLTPRLLAKLLTSSYVDSLPTYADRTHLSHLSDGKRVYNPRGLTNDPDFLAINDPEWADQSLVSPSLSDILVPQGRSDAATVHWTYIVSDPDAVDFLKGKADPWGMTVNPWSATTAKANTSGAALTLPRDDFPKADPVVQEGTDTEGPIDLITWRPFVTDFSTSAYLTLRGDGQVLGAWDPLGVPVPKYQKAARYLPGQQRVLGLTDTSAAARYQVYTAALRNPAGRFVSAGTDSMRAAAAAMTPAATQSQVYGFAPESAPAKAAATAYPLTVPVYAAASPAIADAAVRSSYATFIRYAATNGQEPGVDLGQLPDGYAPIPDSWRTQALNAAVAIEAGAATPPPTEEFPDQPAGEPGADGGSGTGAGDGSGLGSGGLSGDPSSSGTGDPDASGAAAGALSGPVTPADPELAAMPAAVPTSLLAGLAGACAVPVIGRMRRRL